MTKLESFSIRNMPVIDESMLYAMPSDYILKGFAARFIDIVMSGRFSGSRPALNTMSIGAPLYRDLHIGASPFSGSLVADFLQLRIYHVDCSYQALGVPSITLTQVAKGTPDEALRLGVNTFSHSSYWLG